METLQLVREKNPHLNIKPVTDTSFSKYGQVHDSIKVDGLIKNALDYANMTDKVVIYEASVPELEKDQDLMTDISRKIHGEMPIQIGICNGWNTKLNGLEYHKGSEFLTAATDLVLLLGDLRDIEFGSKITYDTSKVEAYFVEAGTSVELYHSALHYAPVHVWEDKGFIAVITLPRGTNTSLKYPADGTGENKLLLAVNKWLIVHPEAANGEYVGLTGENIEVNPL